MTSRKPSPFPRVKKKTLRKTSVSTAARVHDARGVPSERKADVHSAVPVCFKQTSRIWGQRWRERRKWSHLTDRPCYYCYFGSPVMRRAGEPLVSETTRRLTSPQGPRTDAALSTSTSSLTRRREPRWRLGGGREDPAPAPLLHSGRPQIKRRQKTITAFVKRLDWCLHGL